MPELPEVEVVKLFLEDKIVGSTIRTIDIYNSKSFKGDPNLVVGSKVKKLSRVGKQLSIHLDNQYILLVHLKMTGQLILVGRSDKTVLGHPTKDAFSSALPNRSTRIKITFDNPHILFFNDQRKFGWIQIFTPQDLKTFQSNLGLDIFDPLFTPEYLFAQLKRTSRSIKLALLDQNLFAGIGNIYANDALFLSGIHPQLPANQVTNEQTIRIYHSLVSVMQQSVLSGGSTAKDNKYVRPDGSYGQNQFHFRVYQRDGQPCIQCGTAVSKIKLGGRGTFYCPKCQSR